MTTTYFLNNIMGNVFKVNGAGNALPSAYYLGLSSTNPADEVTEPYASADNTTGYKRVKLEDLIISDEVGGEVTNQNAVSFEESTGDWGTMHYFVIYDSEENGNLLMYDKLESSRSVEPATVVTVKPGSLKITLTSPAE